MCLFSFFIFSFSKIRPHNLHCVSGKFCSSCPTLEFIKSLRVLESHFISQMHINTHQNKPQSTFVNHNQRKAPVGHQHESQNVIGPIFTKLTLRQCFYRNFPPWKWIMYFSLQINFPLLKAEQHSIAYSIKPLMFSLCLCETNLCQ